MPMLVHHCLNSSGVCFDIGLDYKKLNVII
jgi:hypothetical protein